MNLERLRSHPARYLVPNAMTLARPVLGYRALQAARKGDWTLMEKYLVPALASDMEGGVARSLNATSTFGSIGDPIADAILRAQTLIALAPKLSTTTKSVVLAGEMINLGLNSKIQSASGRPTVPIGAKLGSFTQAVGAGMFAEGLRRDSSRARLGGEAGIVAGTAIRVGSYVNLYRRTRNNSAK